MLTLQGQTFFWVGTDLAKYKHMNKHKKLNRKPKNKFLNQGSENTYTLTLTSEFCIGSLSILALHLIFLLNDPKKMY